MCWRRRCCYSTQRAKINLLNDKNITYNIRRTSVHVLTINTIGSTVVKKIQIIINNDGKVNSVSFTM